MTCPKLVWKLSLIPLLISEIYNGNSLFWKCIVWKVQSSFESMWTCLNTTIVYVPIKCLFLSTLMNIKNPSSLDSSWIYWTFMNSEIWLFKSKSTYAWSHLIETSITICSFFRCFSKLLWVCPSVSDQIQLIIPMDLYSHKELNLCSNSFMKILDLKESCNLIVQEDLWQ